MKSRRNAILLVVVSVLVSVGAFAALGGAATPSVSINVTSGPAGTAITVTLPAVCALPNVSGAFGGIIVTFTSETPSGPGTTSQVYFESPGDHVSHVQFVVPVSARKGHYKVAADCVEAAPQSHEVEYGAKIFAVTGGPALPSLTLNKTSGPVGTHIDVSGPCTPTGGLPTATFNAALFSAAKVNLAVTSLHSGTGPTIHTTLTVPGSFLPGTYFVAASCSDYGSVHAFAEHAFTVVASAPSAPSTVKATPGTTHSTTAGPILVAHSASANHGAAITKYTATCTSNNGGATRSAVHLGASTTPILVTSATLKRHYSCTVKATNAKGTSAASAASNTITVGAPVAPATPSATKTAPGRLRVTFTNLTAAQANGSALSTPKYTAQCRSTNGGATKSATGPSSPIAVGGLTAGKTYRCTVSAHNARGSGSPSAPSAPKVA